MLSREDAAFASDTSGYVATAKGIVQEGKYCSEYRLPIYPFLIAAIMLFTDDIQNVVLFLQIICLFATGLTAMRIAGYFGFKHGAVVLFLVIFNPCAILYSHLILPDTLFTSVFLLYVLFLIGSYHKGNKAHALGAGICTVVLTLTRGNGLYLIILMPFIIMLGYSFFHRKLPSGRVIQLCAISLGTAIVGLAPWLCYNLAHTGQLRINSPEYVNYTVHENVVRVEYLALGKSKEAAKESVLHKARKYAGISESQSGINSAHDAYQMVAKYAKDILLGYPSRVLAYAMAKSLGYFILDPGYKGFANHLAIDSLAIDKQTLGADVSVSGFFSELFLSRSLSIKVYSFFVVYILLLRILGLIGIASLVRQRRYDLLTLCIILIFYFTFISGFIGYARYRLPIDPLLILLAACGGQSLYSFFRNIGRSHKEQSE